MPSQPTINIPEPFFIGSRRSFSYGDLIFAPLSPMSRVIELGLDMAKLRKLRI